MRLNIATRNKLLDDGLDFDGGTLYCYTLPRPASAEAAVTGTLLGSVTLPTPALAAAVSGVVAKAGTWAGTGVAAGTVGYGRLVSATGDRRIDLLAGTELLMDDYEVTEDGSFEVTGVAITMPAGV